MSAYYSKFSLNSYAGTPYFQAHVPEGFPVYLLLQKARAFRRLPPNLKTLARNSRRWAELHDAVPGSIAEWYDAQGYELDPNDGHRLTDAEIDAQWEPDPGLDAVMVTDIPMPPRGFAAPDEWELPEAPVEARVLPSRAVILRDVATAGIKAVEETYGIDLGGYQKPPSAVGMPWDKATALFSARRERVLASPYFEGLESLKDELLHVLQGVDIYEDLWGQAQMSFDRAEEYNAAMAATEDWPDQRSLES